MLTFDFGKTGANPDPNKKYVEIYVTGDVSTKGGGSQTDGSIVIVNGVYVKMYVGGNMNMGGNGLVNNNGNAASLSIYGITPRMEFPERLAWAEVRPFMEWFTRRGPIWC